MGKLNAEIAEILRNNQVRERLAALGAVPQPQSPAGFARFINDDLAKWTQVLREAEAKQSKQGGRQQ